MDNVYYEQKTLWGNGIQGYQKQVLETLKQCIPNDVKTILDVGCGDGLITNPLNELYDVTGMDISEEALQYIKGKKLVGNILNIPVEDEYYDLVMVNDVLEHIEEESYSRALHELARVSRNYIIVTVPNEEDIENKKVLCQSCGTTYHINLHQRAYNQRLMKDLCIPVGLDARMIIYTGEVGNPPHNPLTKFQHALKMSYEWEGAVCPNCKWKYTVDNTTDKKLLYAVRQEFWKNNLIYNNRSEIMALYSKKNKGIDIKPIESESLMESLMDIDFSNILQKVEEIGEGQEWTRWECVSGVEITHQGIKKSESAQVAYLRLYYPLLNEKDSLELIGENIQNCSVRLYGIDSLSGHEIELKKEEDGSSGKHIYNIPLLWNAGQFGYQIDMYISGEGNVEKFLYLGNTRNKVAFAVLRKGMNMIKLRESKGVPFFYSVLTESKGKIPILTEEHIGKQQDFKLIYDKMVYSYQNSFRIYKKNQETLVQSNTELSKEINNLGRKLEENRQIIEEKIKMIEEKIKMIEELNMELVQKEQRLKDKKQLLKDKDADILQLAKRKRQKILVLSNMFPTMENRINGCFIHEQVRALREYENIDARVISCKPFWFNGFKVWKFQNAKKVFEQEVEQSHWSEIDGVPVFYLPYKVGKPLYPFELHSRNYTKSILRVITRIYREFPFDLIHAHTSYLDGEAARALSRKLRVPYVLTEHMGPFSLLTDRVEVRRRTLRAIRDTERIWAVSAALKESIAAWFPLPEEKERIGVLHNGVEMSNFEIKEHNDLQEAETIQIMTVGYMEDVKNPINLVKAFAKLYKKNGKVRLNMVGDGSLYNKVLQEIKTLNLLDVVKLYGLKTREEVAKLMRDKCDIFVLPSKTETFGVVLIEAMACGKPLVATKCGGPESIITDRVGVLCDNDNSESMCNAIEYVIEHYQDFHSGEIRKYAEEHFSFQTIAKRLNDAYQSV